MRVTSLAVVLLVTVASAADPPGTPQSRAALATCERSRDASDDEGAALVAAGLAQARDAVAADDRDALAHFAVFCNLGEQLRRRGVSLRSLVDLRSLRAEVDRTIQLAPDVPDAYRGKGMLLLGSPGFLGGDAALGERFLRQALVLDPDDLTARFDLVRALQRRGAVAEARAEAERALAIARRVGDPSDVETARVLLGGP